MNKTLRDYVPGQKDFLHFANIMNHNAQIDLKRDGQIKAGAFADTVAPSSVAPNNANVGTAAGVDKYAGLSSSERYNKIVGDFKSALKGSVTGSGYKYSLGGK